MRRIAVLCSVRNILSSGYHAIDPQVKVPHYVPSTMLYWNAMHCTVWHLVEIYSILPQWQHNKYELVGNDP